MKITHITRKMNMEEHPGGVETFILELAEKQRENGHEVEILCRNMFNEPEKETTVNGFKVKKASTISKPGLGTLSSLFSMRKLIGQQKTDIFHIHDWSPYLNYLAAGKPGKHILTVHDLHDEFLQRKIQNFTMKNSDQTIMVSEEMNQRTQKQDYKVIRNGVNTNKFNDKENTENFALFVGDLNDRKGFKELITNWPEDAPKLKIVGTGKYEHLQEKHTRHEFLGRIPEKQLTELYSKAQYVVLPSRREGFCLVWIEALASGTPILYTNTGIGPQIPEKYGVRINKNYTQEELQTAIQKLLQKDYDRDQIREHAKKQYSWQKTHKQYMRLYTKAK